MDRKEAFEKLLAKVDADKRDEAYDRLNAVETRAEKIAIFEEYGVDADKAFGEGWSEHARELSDDELEMVAGGIDWAETWKSRDCNCEP